MKNKFLKILIATATLIAIAGCGSAQVVKPVSNTPKWLDDPYVDNDSVAAVGCARAHYDGIPGQKKLAVANAIDEIASQVNTTVQNVTTRTKKYNDGVNMGDTQDSSSLHSVSKMSLQTKIKAYYTKNNGEICAWVIQK